MKSQALDERFFLLDGIRGVAALIVLLVHTGILLHMPWPKGGEIAVDIFFCLSGFVLCHVYGRENRQTMLFSQFFIRRFIRLYPMIFLGVMVGGFLFFISPNSHKDYSIIMMIMTFLMSFVLFPIPLFWGIHSAFTVDGALWSLLFEFILSSLIYITIKFRFSARSYFGLCLLLAIGLICAAKYVGDVLLIGIGGLDSYILAIFRTSYPFFAGAGIACLERRVSSLPSFLIVAISFICFAFLNNGSSGSENAAIRLLFCLIGVPALIYFGSSIKTIERSAVICEWLGGLSYPLYVVHLPILQVMVVLRRNFYPGDGYAGLGIYILTIIACIIVSQLILLFYDIPARRSLGNFLLTR